MVVADTIVIDHRMSVAAITARCWAALQRSITDIIESAREQQMRDDSGGRPGLKGSAGRRRSPISIRSPQLVARRRCDTTHRNGTSARFGELEKAFRRVDAQRTGAAAARKGNQRPRPRPRPPLQMRRLRGSGDYPRRQRGPAGEESRNGMRSAADVTPGHQPALF
jgi:hypothetical protein